MPPPHAVMKILFLEIYVQSYSENVVVAGEVGSIVYAFLFAQLYTFCCLLMRIEGVEVGQVQVHFLVDVINTTDGNRVGACDK